MSGKWEGPEAERLDGRSHFAQVRRRVKHRTFGSDPIVYEWDAEVRWKAAPNSASQPLRVGRLASKQAAMDLCQIVMKALGEDV